MHTSIRLLLCRFAALERLLYLSLSNNALERDDISALCDMSTLTYLDLSLNAIGTPSPQSPHPPPCCVVAGVVVAASAACAFGACALLCPGCLSSLRFLHVCRMHDGAPAQTSRDWPARWSHSPSLCRFVSGKVFRASFAASYGVSMNLSPTHPPPTPKLMARGCMHGYELAAVMPPLVCARSTVQPMVVAVPPLPATGRTRSTCSSASFRACPT